MSKFQTSKKTIKARGILKQLQQVTWISCEVLGSEFPDQCASMLERLVMVQTFCEEWDGLARSVPYLEKDIAFWLETTEATCKELCELADISPLC